MELLFDLTEPREILLPQLEWALGRELDDLPTEVLVSLAKSANEYGLKGAELMARMLTGRLGPGGLDLIDAEMERQRLDLEMNGGVLPERAQRQKEMLEALFNFDLDGRLPIDFEDIIAWIRQAIDEEDCSAARDARNLLCIDDPEMADRKL